MRIGELARATGLSRDTLRFYERRGLVQADRGSNGYRDFPEEAVFVVDLVRTAQALGFTLAEIEAELSSLTQDGLSQEQVAEILRSKIVAIDDRISRLAALRNDLADRMGAACPLVHPAT